MDKKILILAKSIETLVTREMSDRGYLDRKPSVSYVSSVALNFPAIVSILSGLKGDELVRVIFVSFNLLNGDSDEVAMSRAKDIFMIDVKSIQGEEYNKMEDCDVCYGNGEVRCEECDGEGEVESSTEVVDVEMSTILTQSHQFIEELDTLHDPNDDEIKEYTNFIEKYIEEILVIDVIDDTIEFDYEWGGDSSVRDKLEAVRTNFKNYKVTRNRFKGKNEITALK